MAQGNETVETAPAQQPQQTIVQSAEFAEVSGSAGAPAGAGIDVLLDVKVPVKVCLGDSRISVREVLQLGPGSVVELNKPVESPAELFLNQSKFATGSIVVVDGKFGIKIEQILAPQKEKDAN